MNRHNNFLLKYSGKTIPQIILYRKYLCVLVGNDHVSGVPKAAKNNQNYTSSKLSITTRLQ
jgi:hypothetical protein